MTIDKNILLEVSKKHPACSMDFGVLYSGLMAEVEKGNVNMSKNSTGELELFDYSLQCQFEGNWNVFTLISRGLILCPGEKRVVSLCMPKFFNVQELEFWTPQESFSTTEKADGSCIFIWFFGGWHCSTRGSFASDQAKWAEKWLYKNVDLDRLNPALTYICEAVYPENRVVVKYDWSGLVFITSYNKWTGKEYCPSYVKELGFLTLNQHNFSSIDKIVSLCEKLSANEEGFVVQFQNGLRMKIKSKEYLLVHKAKSSLSPLSAWESLMECLDLTTTMKLLPDEFFKEWTDLVAIFEKKFAQKVEEIKKDHLATLDMTDKELGMSKHPNKNFIFATRKNNLLTECYNVGKARKTIFNTFRPTANIIKE